MVQEELDPRAILQSLGMDNATSITPVQGGYDTTIWRVDIDGVSYALRVFRSGEEQFCHRERQGMEAVAQIGLPVPRVHAEGNWQERPALLLSWMQDQTVGAVLSAKPWRARKLGMMCGMAHARLHTIAVPELLSQLPSDWIEWAPLEDGPLRKRLYEIGRQKSVLLHMDFHPFNLMTDGEKVTGILDWKIAHAGDPRADAARTVSLLSVPTFGKVNIAEVLVRRIFLAGWRAGYQRQGGSLTEMSLFYAWAGAVLIYDLGERVPARRLPGIKRWAARWRRQAEREMTKA